MGKVGLSVEKVCRYSAYVRILGDGEAVQGRYCGLPFDFRCTPIQYR